MRLTNLCNPSFAAKFKNDPPIVYKPVPTKSVLCSPREQGNVSVIQLCETVLRTSRNAVSVILILAYVCRNSK